MTPAASERIQRPPIATWVAVGSGIGGLLRVLTGYLVLASGLVSAPFAILTVNLLGSFGIGLLATATAADSPYPLSSGPRHFLLAGICGGFTTFSFFSLQTAQLIEQGNLSLAAIYSLATLAGGLIAAGLGHRLASHLRNRRGRHPS